MRNYFIANLSAIRRTVQASFGLFTLYVGFQFFQFYQWAMGQGAYVPRPPAVEAFLPISALMGLKRFVYTGEFDPVHPAGLVILMAALSISLLARKGFCGWICPVGFASHLAQWLSGKLHIQFRLPNWLSFLLSGFKYILLAFFLYVIVWSMDVAAITSFLQTPYNVGADAKMLQFFLAPSTITIFVLSFLVVVSFFLINFWCRFLCPYGALLGLIAYFSPLTIHRDAAQCIQVFLAIDVPQAAALASVQRNRHAAIGGHHMGLGNLDESGHCKILLWQDGQRRGVRHKNNEA